MTFQTPIVTPVWETRDIPVLGVSALPQRMHSRGSLPATSRSLSCRGWEDSPPSSGRCRSRRWVRQPDSHAAARAYLAPSGNLPNCVVRNAYYAGRQHRRTPSGSSSGDLPTRTPACGSVAGNQVAGVLPGIFSNPKIPRGRSTCRKIDITICPALRRRQHSPGTSTERQREK